VRHASGDALKVLHVIPSVAPRYGGPSRAVIEMCRALRKRGIDTLIATTDADGGDRLKVELGRPVLYEAEPAMFFSRQGSEAYKYSRSFASWLDAHVNDFDVVHIHAVFSHACIAAGRACRREGVPYVVRPLGTLDPWSLGQKRLRKRVFWHLGVRQLLEGAAAIHYTTVAERALAEESLHLTSGVVIPLGVEAELFDQTEEMEPETSALPSMDLPYVLVLSRLHQKKGLEVLLRAFLSLVRRPEFGKWNLVLAGDGEKAYVDSLKSLTESCGGNGNVRFAGWIDGKRRRTMLRQASLLALTSYQENFGQCAAEALACGVPVIVSQHVNLAPEIEAVNAGWITALEPEAIERTLAEALGNAERRAQRGSAGREFVRSHFSWAAVAGQLAGAYDSIV
jgi:glycosyltransferase involved in cell wall biosynthesis